ncbi:MAG: glycosyltransferase [Phocaeicola vulgatus]
MKLSLSDEISSSPFASYSMGKISDEYSLTLLYNAVDVYVTSSLAESFGQTIIEAQACGTIPVGFDLGGIPDIIEHEKTGYLAREKRY